MSLSFGSTASFHPTDAAGLSSVWIDPDARLSDWEDPPDEYTAYAHDSSSSDGISTDESMSWAYS